ncbi:MAG: DNA topoisomerase (ATP-hydrolyzing) subunit B [Spirochaetaceae bacterium]|nr:DNA topoisomerase (ATP-hydrolyzing) subunit B [Spirochaetaceae bacterium]
MTAKYSAGNIQVLKGLEAVRKRPGMYIGSTGIDGLHHLIYEVVDNCIDETMAGVCDSIEVVFEKDDVVRVTDNGRGIPVDIHPTEGISALELVLTRLHAGGKFDKGSYKVSGGLHGVGVSCVNALSEWLEAVVEREGKKHRMTFARGITTSSIEDLGPSERRGTTIRWKADKEIFTDTTTYNFDVISSRLRELAFLNNGVQIIFRDERLSTPKEVIFHFEGGITQFVTYLNDGKKTIPQEPIYITGEKDDVITEIALQYNDGYSENILSFVNDINTREGGSHLEGFKSALTSVLNDFLKKNTKLMKKMEKEEKLSGDDVRAGLTAVISMKVPEPQFEGQTKTKLGNTEVRSIVSSLANEQLTLFFEQNPQVVDLILEKAVSEAMARIAARNAKEATRRKSGMDSFGLPGKLADCSSKDPTECEVYIVEGDSAGGSAKQGRNPKIQAILPLWGKMLNVEKTRLDKVIGNDKLQPVIASLGTGIGKDFDISKLRYHKIIIMADADVDGSHISTLLLTFFFRYMPELIEQGHVYIAMPPLYKIKSGKKEVFVFSDEERDVELKALNGAKADVQRYKGLGEMEWKELKETTMDPAHRKMKQVKLVDAVEADRIFSVLMGEEVEPRRKFIEENATYATLDV